MAYAWFLVTTKSQRTEHQVFASFQTWATFDCDNNLRGYMSSGDDGLLGSIP